MSTSYKGPLLGNPDSFAGALAGTPVDFAGRADWITYFNDFIQEGIDYNETTFWTETAYTTGAATIHNAAGYDMGVLKLDGGATADDGTVAQLDGGASQGSATLGVLPADASSVLHATDALMVTRWRYHDVDDMAVFVGLAELEATSSVLVDTATLTTSDNHIGFHAIETDAGSIRFSTAGTAAANVVQDTSVLGTPLADAGWIETAVRVVGTTTYESWVRVPGGEWYAVARGTGTAFNAQMVPTFACIGDSVGDDLDIDYMYFAKRRNLTIPS
jgi:hypothetical protein